MGTATTPAPKRTGFLGTKQEAAVHEYKLLYPARVDVHGFIMAKWSTDFTAFNLGFLAALKYRNF